ncbi:uncharacterized protein [Aegilops tauschii subsp. strangulata]|uniref:uncharacterized protein n=1 Tax=Aegilops tauschii subsp. strangulata TaxID=200361 RepID=UPI00098B635D|nr:uncharacterized protein LOC109740956 [Aegilops tauschii subsp. strangulata]
MSWNVRGLNNPARRSVVQDTANTHRLAILCIQETKLEEWMAAIAREVGGQRLDDCIVLPANGTRGGAAIFWDSTSVRIQSHAIGEFSITAKVTVLSSGASFWLTTVYGPSESARKDIFLAELVRGAPPRGEPWLLNGDFNIIYEARNKNNSNINRRIMRKFRAAIDAGGLREIKCKNRRFTWSSERQDPTLASIDKFFSTIEWEVMFPDFMLHAASTSCSDHCPLLLAAVAAPRLAPRFRFESFWPRFARFHETVQRAWQRPAPAACAFDRLNIKMHRVARDLKIWSRSLFSDAKMQLQLATLVVLRLDIAQERRPLTQGTRQGRANTIDWSYIDMPRVQGGGLDNPFTEQEVWQAIKQSSAEKSPGPDGFSGVFFRSCWPTIKRDVMEVFHQFYHLAGENFQMLNIVAVVLLPKKDGAAAINDYRPISLIHSVAKLISKVLSLRLATSLHSKKTPALPLKLDNSKAFDNVSWGYLLELLQQLGFSARWRNWIALLLSTSSSTFLLNGVAGPKIVHRKGLR